MKKKFFYSLICISIFSLTETLALAFDVNLGMLFRTRYMANNFPIGGGVGNHHQKYPGTNSATDHGYDLTDQRIDISMIFNISNDLKGVIILTNGNNSLHPFSFPQWGRNGICNSAIGTTGSGGLIAHTHKYNLNDSYSTFFGELNFRNAYIDFNLSNNFIPLNLKIGRQNLKIGHGIVFSASPDAIAINTKYRNIDLGCWTAKISEGGLTQSDDWDMYTLWANYSLNPNHKFGASILYEYGKSGTLYDQEWAYAGSANALIFSTFSQKIKYKPWIVSLTADGKIDPFTYRAEFNYMGGTIKNNESDSSDLNISAWSAMVGGDYQISLPNKKAAKIGIEVAYGSGEEDDKGYPSHHGNYNGFLMHDPEWWYADLMSDLIGLYLLNGLNNRAYFKISGEIKPINKLIINTAYLYNWAPQTSTEGRYQGKSHFMGHEFDIAATFEIFKNLTFEIKYAYLFAGPFYRDPDGDSPTDPYGVTGNFILKF